MEAEAEAEVEVDAEMAEVVVRNATGKTAEQGRMMSMKTWRGWYANRKWLMVWLVDCEPANRDNRQSKGRRKGQ